MTGMAAAQMRDINNLVELVGNYETEYCKKRKYPLYLGQHLQHFLVIVGDIAAISSGISGKFLLIQALHIVQRLLCAVPQQAVCIPLKGGQVVQRRRILRLFLAGDALDRCHHLLSTGFQQVFSNVFFRNAAAGCRASAVAKWVKIPSTSAPSAFRPAIKLSASMPHFLVYRRKDDGH